MSNCTCRLFSGLHHEIDSAVERAKQMIGEGADIIDIGYAPVEYYDSLLLL